MCHCRLEKDIIDVRVSTEVRMLVRKKVTTTHIEFNLHR